MIVQAVSDFFYHLHLGIYLSAGIRNSGQR